MKIEIKEERILEKIELFIQENNLPFEIEIPKKESENEYEEEMKMKGGNVRERYDAPYVYFKNVFDRIFSSKEKEEKEVSENKNIISKLFPAIPSTSSLFLSNQKEQQLGKEELFIGKPKKESVMGEPELEKDIFIGKPKKESVMGEQELEKDMFIVNPKKESVMGEQELEKDMFIVNPKKESVMGEPELEKDIFMGEPKPEMEKEKGELEKDMFIVNPKKESVMEKGELEKDMFMGEQEIKEIEKVETVPKVIIIVDRYGKPIDEEIMKGTKMYYVWKTGIWL